MNLKVAGVLETCIYAGDIEAAEAFYRSVLGLDAFQKAPGRHVFFYCGPQAVFLVFNPEATAQPDMKLGVPSHGAAGPGHVTFSIREAEMAAWRERLGEEGVAVEKEVDWPGGGRSIYFRDPAGNSVEIASPRIWRLPEPS